MRIVFDTNVLIAAALKSGLARDIRNLAAQGDITLIASEFILLELSEKLHKKFHWDQERIVFNINTLRLFTEIVDVTNIEQVVDKDPDDDKVLAAAVDGQADLIVSSDKHLLKLKKYRGIAIVHPKTLSYMFPLDPKA